MKLIIMIFGCFFLSCSNGKKDEIEIIDPFLISEIKYLIQKIDDMQYCKSDYLTVTINRNKIYISNSVPTNSDNYLGNCFVGKSKVYFYSNINYSKYLNINSPKPFRIDKNYSNKCHPDVDNILLINNNDGSLKRWKLGNK
ncbi:hypothetical protein [Flavobacterium koreense]